MKEKFANKLKLTPVQVLSIGFAILILIGATLLTLPISTNKGIHTPFLDCLFTATSALCVTGLITLDPGTHWNYFGRTILMFLIEIGGLGFMTFSILISLILGRKITLSERLIVQEAFNSLNIQGLVKMTKSVLKFTFGIEGIAAIILSTQFIPEFGFLKGLYYGVFHAVSAFCNAGFDILGLEYGPFKNMISVNQNPVIIICIAFLIIIGGIGFGVIIELYAYTRSKRKMSLHAKLTLIVTTSLLILGAILFFVFEHNNPNTMGNMNIFNKILNSFFASVTPRTAGFASISTTGMIGSSKLLTIILMFIGGSPGSTAGGVKTVTFAVVIVSIYHSIRGHEDTTLFKKSISKDLIKKAFTVFITGFLLVVIMTMLLSIIEGNKGSLETYLYEVTSAFGTVGLSLDYSPKLHWVSKILISFTMYLGRVGPLTVAIALGRTKTVGHIKYPEEKILIG